MRILFVADGRSPIALNWIQHFTKTGHEVHLASTFPSQPALSLKSLHTIPVAFNSAAGEAGSYSGEKNLARKNNIIRTLTTPRLRTAFRQWFGPLTLTRAARRLQALINTLQPELVHAMRIPYEGMIASQAKTDGIPLIISVWGNDFTLHAQSTPQMTRLTQAAMHQADALHTDCYRDLWLAYAWEFDKTKPHLTIPGNGGIDLDVFYPASSVPDSKPEHPSPTPIKVINPRGFRAYVRNDTFFKAIPLVLSQYPDTKFILPAMAGDSQANPYRTWLHENNASHAVEFLPVLPREQLAEQFRQALIAVSPTEHDGTPNTLLEAMACGCLPIAGDLESVREWITPGDNGLLFDPANPQFLAESILRAIEDKDLQERAAKKNARLIADRAEYHQSMMKAEAFYTKL